MQKIKKGYKYIKGIGEIPEEWEVKKFGDIIKLAQYGTSKSSNSNYGYPVLRMGNLDNGKLYLDNLVYVYLNEEEFKNLKINKGDLLFNRTNSYELVGKTALFETDGDYVCASYLIRFVLNNNLVNNKFINYYFNTFKTKQKLKSLATRGVSQSNINATTLRKTLLLPVPSLSEQQKIAQILLTWDEAIDKTEKLIKEKKIQKKALMQKLLSGEKRLKEFKKEEWKEIKLGDVLYFKKKEAVTNPKEHYLLTVKLHLKGIEATKNRPNVTKKGRPYYLRKPNELLIGRQNFHNGGIGIVPSKMKGYIASNAISSIGVKKGDLKFYYYYLSNSNFYKKIGYIIGGTGQKEISESMMKTLKLVIPLNINEQRAIANILTAADKEINILNEKLDVLEQQKKGLMQNLLTGKIRVKV